MTDLDKESFDLWLQASMYWRGVTSESTDSTRALTWIRRVYEAGLDAISPTLIIDLAHLLLHGRKATFSSSSELKLWPSSEKSFRLHYEDETLGRWAIDQSVRRVQEMLAGLKPEAQENTLVHAITLAFAQIEPDADVNRANPAHMRDEQLAKKGLLSFSERQELVDDDWAQFAKESLVFALDKLSFTKEKSLFSREDLWEIEHLARLPSEAMRLALRQVHRVQAKIGAAEPEFLNTLKNNIRETTLDDTEVGDAPIGGLEGLSLKGRFENLVRSEIAYVGETVNDRLDLFDLRFVEGELLYYTRDETPRFDVFRRFVLVIDRPYRLRRKSKKAHAQDLVLVCGMLLAMKECAFSAFGVNNVHISLMFRSEDEDDEEASYEAMAVLEESLLSDIQHERVHVALINDWSALPPGRLLVFSPQPKKRKPKARAWVSLSENKASTGGPEISTIESSGLQKICVDALTLLCV